jgi:hypothetical protein
LVPGSTASWERGGLMYIASPTLPLSGYFFRR